jgi:hypothetical protein
MSEKHNMLVQHRDVNMWKKLHMSMSLKSDIHEKFNINGSWPDGLQQNSNYNA